MEEYFIVKGGAIDGEHKFHLASCSISIWFYVPKSGEGIPFSLNIRAEPALVIGENGESTMMYPSLETEYMEISPLELSSRNVTALDGYSKEGIKGAEFDMPGWVDVTGMSAVDMDSLDLNFKYLGENNYLVQGRGSVESGEKFKFEVKAGFEQIRMILRYPAEAYLAKAQLNEFFDIENLQFKLVVAGRKKTLVANF